VGLGGEILHDWKAEEWDRRGSVAGTFAVCDPLDIGIAAYEAAIAAYDPSMSRSFANAVGFRANGGVI
jgi:hypothetical protein